MTDYNTKYWTELINVSLGGEIKRILESYDVERIYSKIGGAFSFIHYGNLPHNLLSNIQDTLLDNESIIINKLENKTISQIILKR